MATDRYTAILTSLGEAKFAAAIGSKSAIDLARMAIGDGRGADISPNKTMSALVREVWRGDVSSTKVDPLNPNLVSIECTVPPNIGGFTVREVGVFDTAGDLIVIANYPATFKPIAAAGADKTLVVQLTLNFSNPETTKAVTIFDYKSKFKGLISKSVPLLEGIVEIKEGTGVSIVPDISNNLITLHSLTKDWAQDQAYLKDSTVVFDGELLRCKDSHKSSINFVDDKPLYWESIVGGATGNITAAKVSYFNNGYPNIVNVEQALNKLMYSAPTLSASNTVGTVEIGTIIRDFTINWNITTGSNIINSLSLTPGPGILDLGLRSYSFSNQNITANKSFTISISDGVTPKSASTTIAFSHKRYWGASSKDILSDADILALNNEFSGSRSKTINPFVCSAQYMYYIFPDSLGAPTFQVNGLPNTDWILVQREFINSVGLSAQFRIYRSGNLLTGSYNVVVQ